MQTMDSSRTDRELEQVETWSGLDHDDQRRLQWTRAAYLVALQEADGVLAAHA